MEARSTSRPYIEPEPADWQPRVLWASGRLLAGSACFFFASFVFAYFYLRSLDVDKSWKIGAVNPSIGLAVAIVVVLGLSAALLHLATRRPLQSLAMATGALVLALLAVVLQVIQWTTLGFGPASGGSASVFVGWTSMYAVFALACAYWIETQLATIWRARRQATPASETVLLEAGLKSCSFFWTFYVALGVLAFVILYLV
jgi:heme/copper-type cytochrome/quinol oxidase subunit 3